MATRKTERILNLTICLLVSGRYLPKSRIREAVEALPRPQRRRVRAHLRARQGRVAQPRGADRGGQLRPAVRRRARLPDLAGGVRAAADRARRRRGGRRRGGGPGLAARQHGRVDPQRAGEAARRRASSRTPPNWPRSNRPCRPPRRPSSRCGPRCWSGPGSASPTATGVRRTLEPWGMTSSKGRWYVIGWDTDRQAERMFKLSRMTDLPERVSRPGAYEVPADLDLRSLARSLAPAGADPAAALLAVRAGKGPTLRRRGEPASRPAALPGRLRGVRGRYGDLWTHGRGDHPLRRRRDRARSARTARRGAGRAAPGRRRPTARRR